MLLAHFENFMLSLFAEGEGALSNSQFHLYTFLTSLTLTSIRWTNKLFWYLGD